jgi:uncharacterized protein
MTSTPDTPPQRIASPCIRECCLDQDNICLGCHRSLREICDWSDSSDAERLDILARCDQRRERKRAESAEHGT